MTDLEYIDSHELTETSYVKLGNNSRNLIISEAILHSTHHLNNISSCPTVKKFNSDPGYSNFTEKTSQYLI
jgi:hypothetical protein